MNAAAAPFSPTPRGARVEESALNAAAVPFCPTPRNEGLGDSPSLVGVVRNRLGNQQATVLSVSAAPFSPASDEGQKVEQSVDGPGIRRNSATVRSATATDGPEARKHRLRDLMLRFPCALFGGLRWSVLVKVYRERYPTDVGGFMSADDAAEPLAWLADLATFEKDENSSASGNGGFDGLLVLRDCAALAQGRDGQLACWPLLVQRLGEIVRAQGAPHHANALQVPHEDASTEQISEASGLEEQDDIVGVLLAKLKPLLRRHWDPSFEERAISFFTETGASIGIKKMKHLVAELLKWRVRRRTLGLSTAVDALLQAPIMLAVSLRNNDMVLCCPAGWAPTAELSQLIPQPPPSLLPMPQPPAVAILEPLNGASGATSPGGSRKRRAKPEKFDSASDQTRKWCDMTEEIEAAEGSGSQTAGKSFTREQLDKENRKLRIENAELKKRLRFGSENFTKEIRRLRIENAELQKRLYMAGTTSVCFSSKWTARTANPNPELPTNTAPSAMNSGIWVALPASNAMLMPQGTPASPARPPTAISCHGAESPEYLPSPMSGALSPDLQTPGSLTPIPVGLCYAVPWASPWPNSSLWPPVGSAIQFDPGQVGTNGSGQTPTFSDTSFQNQLLPHSLFGSGTMSRASPTLLSGVASPSRSHGASSNFSPSLRGMMVPSGACGARMMTSTEGDDRWQCIPSGIVRRQTAQFEGEQQDDANDYEDSLHGDIGGEGLATLSQDDIGLVGDCELEGIEASDQEDLPGSAAPIPAQEASATD